MKSIIQEASSVLKAIEKGWESAGKPKEFSIKIFEEPKKNFIGMTVQSAKVGIFFNEKITKEEPEKGAPKKSEPIQRTAKRELYKPEKIEKKESITPKAEPKAATPKVIWTPEMINQTTQWIADVLAHMNLSERNFTIQTHNYQLMINFDNPLITDREKEQQLLRSLSFLLIQTLRHKLNRPLRGFKVIMN